MKVKRICPISGTQYEADSNRLKHGRQTTCSRECSYKFRSQKRSRKITLECATCGKEFCRPPSHIKSKHKAVFCSPFCQYRGRSLGITKRIVTKPYAFHKIISGEDKRLRALKTWQSRRRNGTDRHSKETIKKLSQITTLNIANGKINRVSKIEYKVAEKFKLFDIPFIHQFPIRNPKTGRFAVCLDFYLPDSDIAIEVNGTFWHADPRVYPDRTALRPSQIRTLQKYANKLTILRNLNIPLIEIWELDIIKTPDEFFQPVLKRLRVA